MIYAFDLDGTICEAWYGEVSPNFFEDQYDFATRSIYRDDYQEVRTLPGLVEFINTAKHFYEDKHIPFNAHVISTISNGQEHIFKMNYLRKFAYDDGPSMFLDDNIHGTVSNEDKLHILRYLSNIDDVIYFDDSLSVIFPALDMIRKDSIKNLFPLHVTSLICRTPQEIDNAFNIQKLKP